MTTLPEDKSLATKDIESYDSDMAHKQNPYYRPSVTSDVVIFTIENNYLEVLLINRNNAPFKNRPALPGGFLRKGETSLNATKRILKDKAGLENVYTEQLCTFDDLERDPRGPVLSIAYYSIAPRKEIGIKESDKTEHPHFIPINNLPKLAFDHKEIIKYAVNRLQSKFEYTNVCYSLLPTEFTLTELQNIYEAVLGRPMDKRNFRKKFLQLDLIKDTGHISKGGRQRPARLFKFKKRELTELKKFF